MTTSTILVRGLLAAAALCAAGRLEAQRPPSIMAPKAAAARAAAATNAHITAMTEPGRDPAPRSTAASAATPEEAAAAPAPRPDTLGARAEGDGAAAAVRGGGGIVSFDREAFTYAADGRRDPFFSLMKSGELRPMLSDLRLTAVIYSATGRSVAILRDIGTKQQYRARVGQQLGRMRVSAIQRGAVVFTIDEYGFSRQETLALTDSTTERTQ